MRTLSLIALGTVGPLLVPVASTANRERDMARDTRWIADSLHPEVRGRVHLDASRVPRFPHENPSLSDPHKWPAETVVEGKPCRLKIEAGEYDVVGIPLKSVDEVGPGQSLTLSYAPVRASRSDRCGPVYIWSPSRQLRERYWAEPDPDYWISFAYSYYGSGELYRYSYRKSHWGKSGAPFQWFTEYFERDGELAGVGYSRLDGDGKRALALYRYGQPVSYEDFEKRVGLPRP
jgi:hypothetical protein